MKIYGPDLKLYDGLFKIIKPQNLANNIGRFLGSRSCLRFRLFGGLQCSLLMIVGHIFEISDDSHMHITTKTVERPTSMIWRTGADLGFFEDSIADSKMGVIVGWVVILLISKIWMFIRSGRGKNYKKKM